MGKIIAYDLDGVVYDFMKPLDAEMKEAGFDVRRQFYNIGKRYGTTNEIGFKHLNKLRRNGLFLDMPLFERAKIQMINDARYAEIFIITSRNIRGNGKRHTLERIAKDNLPIKDGNVIFSSKKGVLADRFGIDLFYEDCLANAYDIIDRSYSDVVIVDAAYNKTNDKRFRRVKWGR